MCMGLKIVNIMFMCNRDDVCQWNAKFATASTFEKYKCVSVTLRCVDVYRSLFNMQRITCTHKNRSRKSKKYIAKLCYLIPFLMYVKQPTWTKIYIYIFFFKFVASVFHKKLQGHNPNPAPSGHGRCSTREFSDVRHIMLSKHLTWEILCSVDRASQYNRVKKNQLDAQLILSIFCQPLHVSDVSRPIIRGLLFSWASVTSHGCTTA
jgi:hypothetical protein